MRAIASLKDVLASAIGCAASASGTAQTFHDVCGSCAVTSTNFPSGLNPVGPANGIVSPGIRASSRIPDAGFIHTSYPFGRFEVNAIWEPSGDQVGQLSS